MNTISNAIASKVNAANVITFNPVDVRLGTKEVNGFNLLVLRINGKTHRMILNHVQWQDLKADGIPVLVE
jgi:hypothetical protein